MELPEEILARIREQASKARNQRNPKSFRMPEVSDFTPDVQILAFDQSLASAGWALINTEGDTVDIPESGTIKPPTLGRDVKGFEATFTKSVYLARDIRQLLMRLYGQYEQVVLELPSVYGHRTESSLVAAVTICVTLDDMGQDFPTFVSRQSAAAVLAGDRNASKKQSSEVVERLVSAHPSHVGAWTEHVRDAVFVGLRNLHVGDQ